jgi:hypothetical protein
MSRSVFVMATLGVFFVGLTAGADEGVINLGPEEVVQADGTDIVVPGYSVPSFEDWNNDSLMDLIVGEGGGSAPGKVRVYLNRGTESDPCFADYFYVQSDGQDLVCTPMGCLGCFPRVVYWDGDARKDLLVGQSDGTVRIFLNVADENEPAFDGGAYITVGTEPPVNLDVGTRATSVPVHWNDDGLLDLVVGDVYGLIHIYYNCGCEGGVPPRFYSSRTDGQYLGAGGHDLEVPGGRSSPVIMDLDGDGKKDLLTGNTDGQILFYRNIGLDALPAFSSYTMVQSNGAPIDLAGSLRSRPFVCYWTGEGSFGPRDGYWDLLIGYGDGKIRLYRGLPKLGDLNADGAIDCTDFTLFAEAIDLPVPPQGSPADLNGDGVVDILDLRLFVDIWLAENNMQAAESAE